MCYGNSIEKRSKKRSACMGKLPFIQALKRIGGKILPPTVYFMIYRPALVLGNSERRGSKTKFKIKGDSLYLARDNNSEYIYFCEKTRFRFYHYPEGIRKRLNDVIKKYQSSEVKIKKGDTVIDVGANIGEFSLAVRKIAEKVIAVEPDPSAFRCLERNSKLHPNLQGYNIALSNENGEAKFYLSTSQADSSLAKPEHYTGCITVPTRTLDSLCEEMGLERVNFLKLEAEGWEPDILAGAVSTLSITDRIAIDGGPEWHGQPTSDRVRKTIEKAGFKVTQRGHMVFGSRKTF